MRQLVSVVSDGSLRYFLHDGGEVVQVAQLVDPGVDVGEVIEIGVSLGSLYAKLPVSGLVNGKVKPAVTPAAVSLPPAPAREAPPAKVKVKSPPRKYTHHPLTVEEIIQYVTEHPGITHSGLSLALAAHLDRSKARQLVDNRLRVYFDRCHRDGDAPAIVKIYDSEGAVSYAPVTAD